MRREREEEEEENEESKLTLKVTQKDHAMRETILRSVYPPSG